MGSFYWRWLPVILWAGLIFLASANPDPYQSLTSWWFQPCFSAEASNPSCAELLGRVLHTGEYAVLAALLARTLTWQGERSPYGSWQVFKAILKICLPGTRSSFAPR